ncbi:hypothetical protein WJX64_09200 [Leifsonia sp. YIM 134122]|uniref:Uncharacterized protein n=1 Tax=Leifsonia stereocauli TaxID=3134136 RepID=A0ABU9W3Z2_9MICO
MKPFRGRGAALLSIIAALTLAGCAPSPSSSEPVADRTPTAAASATPAPAPEPTAATELAAALIAFTAEAITVFAEDGTTLSSYDYYQEPQQIIDGLTTVFGGAPVETFHAASGHLTDRAERDWGGFTLITETVPSTIDYHPQNTVEATAAVVRGIRISTVGGFAVGSDIGTAAASYPDEIVGLFDPSNGPVVLRMGPIPLPPTDDYQDDGITTAVLASNSDAGPAIARLWGPVLNRGA